MSCEEDQVICDCDGKGLVQLSMEEFPTLNYDFSWSHAMSGPETKVGSIIHEKHVNYKRNLYGEPKEKGVHVKGKPKHSLLEYETK